MKKFVVEYELNSVLYKVIMTEDELYNLLNYLPDCFIKLIKKAD